MNKGSLKYALQTISKALAAFLAGALLALAARYGVDVNPDTLNAVETVIFAIVSGLLTGAVVWLSPKNKQ